MDPTDGVNQLDRGIRPIVKIAEKAQIRPANWRPLISEESRCVEERWR